MSVFENLPINRKLLAAAALPLAALAVFIGVATKGHIARMEEASAVAKISAQTPAIGAAVHELQRERGTSSGFIGARGERFRSELTDQRRATDSSLEKLKTTVGVISAIPHAKRISSVLVEADTAVAQMLAMRARVDRLDVPAQEAVATYTRAIGQLIQAVEDLETVTTDTAIRSGVRAYVAVLQAKERAGIERATGTNGFAAGRFTQPIYQTLVGLEALQRVFMAEARRWGTPAVVRRLDEVLASPQSAEVERMRRVAAAMPFGGAAEGIDGAAWFAATTRRIDLLKGVEDMAVSELAAIASGRADAVRSSLILESLGAAILLCLSLLLTVLVARAMSRPITALVADMRRLAEGNTGIALAGSLRKDEIGDMTRAVAVFRDNALERARLEAEARAVNQTRLERSARLEAIVGDFNRAIDALLQGVDANANELEATASALSSVAEGTSTRAVAAAAASEEASMNVQMVAESSKELQASIVEIIQRAAQANQSVARASTNAESANGRVTKLAEAVDRISVVVGLIRDIADQTNLLALNATIEAARAGEAGRGFAVVASEVKTLATQTAKATEDVSSHIAGIQRETTAAVAAIDAVARTMGEVEQLTSSIAAAIEEQGSATNEISRNIQEAAAGTSEVSANMSGVTTASEDTRASAGHVLDAAGDLARRAEEIRAIMRGFVNDVQAA